ncbi:MAG: protein kinase [Planctomycetota bacterium]
MDPTSPQDRDLNSLVELCLERMETEGEKALDELCRAHPAQAEALRRRIAGLARTGLLEIGSEEELPERLGEFRILEKLGAGGMGVVYLAEQEGLGRRVAIKLVRPEHLFFPGARERFRREVETIARLQHPGIVPILTIGEERGLPWYAMERVRGRTLAELLDRLRKRPRSELRGGLLRELLLEDEDREGSGSDDAALFHDSWVRTCFEIAVQVADTLEHVHAQGVLHRDLKPSNLMLTPMGRVLLLDFGLARVQDAQELTRTGAAIGTTPYMAPEQVLGDLAQVDARTDVYGLGVCLYELLTLELPFPGHTELEVRDRILDGLPPSPSSRNPSVARDAETVVLTAMDRDPDRRYSGMRELREDLQAFLDLRPVRARNAGPWLRARRWAQRHRGAAVALVLAALILVLGPLSYAVYSSWERRTLETALKMVERQKGFVEQQRDRAEAYAGAAKQVVDRILLETVFRRISALPQSEPARRAILEEALSTYESLLAIDSDDPEMRRIAALARLRYGEVLSLLGKGDEAVAQMLDAGQRLWQLDKDQPGSDEVVAALAEVFLVTGRHFASRGEHAKAIPHWEKARKLLRPVCDREGAPVEWRERLADVEQELLATRLRDLRLDGLEGELDALIALRESLVAEAGPESEAVFGLLEARTARARLDWMRGRKAEATQRYEECLALVTPLVEVPALRIQALEQRAAVLTRTFDVVKAGGHPERTLALAGEILDVARSLCAAHPDRVEYRVQFANAWYRLASTRREQDDRGGAVEAGKAGLAVLAPVLDGPQPTPAVVGSAMALELLLGEVLFEADRGSEAEAGLDAFTTRLEVLRDAEARDAAAWCRLGQFLWERAQIAGRTGNEARTPLIEQALPVLRQGLELDAEEKTLRHLYILALFERVRGVTDPAGFEPWLPSLREAVARGWMQRKWLAGIDGLVERL